MQNDNNQNRPVIIYQNGNNRRAVMLGNGQGSPLALALFLFCIPLILLGIVYLLDRVYGPDPGFESSFLYADPTRDHQPTQDRSWLTPVPRDWLKTPENLQALLSKTPITPESTRTPTPTSSPPPSKTLEPSPTLEPSITLDNGPEKTAEARILAAETDLEIANLTERDARIDRFMDFITRGFSYVCLGSGFVIAILLTVLVIIRVKKELEEIRAQEQRAALLADPILAYPPETRAEIRNVYALLKASSQYCDDHDLDPYSEIRIQRFDKLAGINSDEWTRATNSLVKRGYAMKSPGKPTLLKYHLTIELMLDAVSSGLYMDTGAVLQSSPSPRAN